MECRKGLIKNGYRDRPKPLADMETGRMEGRKEAWGENPKF